MTSRTSPSRVGVPTDSDSTRIRSPTFPCMVRPPCVFRFLVLAHPRRHGQSGALSYDHHQHAALPGGVRREELGDVVVIEREAGGPEPMGVRPEIDPARDDATLELSRPVASV